MNSSAKAGDDAREIAELKPAAGCLPQGDGLDAGELALERELEQVIDWLEALAIFRMERLLRDGDRPRAEGSDAPPPTPLPPDQPTVSPQSTTPWAQLLAELAGDPLAHLALALLLTVQLRPAALDPLQLINPALERRFSEGGGVMRDGAFEPTGDTLALLADGGQMAGRLAVARLLADEGPLRRLGVLGPLEGESPLKAPLRLPGPWLEWLVGTGPRPDENATPASAAGAGPGSGLLTQRLHTQMAWSDLVLHAGTLRQLEAFEQHLRHDATLRQEWGMARRLRPGYRALFHGPPGTGKTLTAALLSQRLGLEARRVDLSRVVSKYIGETEKQLAAVLDRAERRQWLLVFDEADALFGKRSETRDAHDRYANQEVAFLLQRLETFAGVVILATNLPNNLDGAFLRRFESVVYFPLPGPEQRLRLWREAFSPRARLEVDLGAIAERYELSGGLILNVVRQVSLEAIANDEAPIGEVQLLRAIRRELEKEGKGL
ncbi:MAG: hypothetical protein RLZZ609_856 [Cyanobacteriota bacterium]|jgi:hypothetical protein